MVFYLPVIFASAWVSRGYSLPTSDFIHSHTRLNILFDLFSPRVGILTNAFLKVFYKWLWGSCPIMWRAWAPFGIMWSDYAPFTLDLMLSQTHAKSCHWRLNDHLLQSEVSWNKLATGLKEFFQLNIGSVSEFSTLSIRLSFVVNA